MFSRNFKILFFVFLVVFDFFVWFQVISGGPAGDLEVYFFDVGQGDGALVVLPGGVKILIDGGPDGRIIGELSRVLPPTARYIDLVVLSHPQYDHFAGLIEILKRYQVGAFIHNGRDGSAKSFGDLAEIIEKNKIPAVVLAQGDKIKYGGDYFEILSPDKSFISSKELNDTALVMRLVFKKLKVLFTGDIGANVENYLAGKFDVGADVLKVAHHGSKYSSSENFLGTVNPKISAIGVGKNNYGHPASVVIDRLASVGSMVFRTDKDGVVKLVFDGEKINIFKRR